MLKLNHDYVLNGVFWTLGIEMQYYLLAPLLALFFYTLSGIHLLVWRNLSFVPGVVAGSLFLGGLSLTDEISFPTLHIPVRYDRV